ncbi:SusC/RagA family TonB-linked outer membrane protein [Marixanthomonas spongiae]|uniref:SusC/RagA family TonB-linked outer membrane protein n=1 Tax=Marixanthomonas spongiae TaxID=2174845 RepID=A0A2U0HUU3_9FLAO|nr:TonB-dependent receptor [Marixanthomonas spongiae]PVW12618.1 SusC/RagA family TonB-linked outer membrane protein [Marixanthomonas spongiae]
MKLSLFLCFLTAFSFTPKEVLSQNAKININTTKTVSVDEVFDIIMAQTDYQFIYQESIFDNLPKINLKKGTIKANTLLNKSLSQSLYEYDFLSNTTIVIKKKQVQSTQAALQQKIEGTITNTNGTPMVGVTIVIEGTNNGSITDFNGNYELEVTSADAVLVFSSLGYKTQRIPLNGQTILDVVMQEDFSRLDQVMLIGYGKQKREDVTGAVSSVDTDELVQSATGNIGFDRALGGLVKGVQVSQGSGRPGSPVRLNIRGITSPLSSLFGGGLNQPLYVIDGVPFNLDNIQGANPLLTINPNDIKSFDILKDAAATSIYGSRGANGVIIIETKKGKRGEGPSMNFSTSTTLAEPINTVEVLNASQYRDFYDLLIKNSVNAINAGQLDSFYGNDLNNVGIVDFDGQTYTYNGLRDDYFGDADTDWNDLVYRSAAITKQANFSLNGGSEATNYALSLAAIDQEGLTVRDELKQYTLSMSLNTDVNNYITTGGSVNVSHTNSESGKDDLFGQYTLNTSIARARPDLPAYDENGMLMGQPDYGFGFLTLEPNPLMRLENKTSEKSYNFIGNGFVEIEPLKKLKLKLDVNAAVFHNRNRSFVPKITQTDFISFGNDSFLSTSEGLVTNLTTNLTANYGFNLSDHHFNILAGAAWDRTNFESSSQLYTGFPDDDVLINGTSAESVLGYTDDRTETGLNSLFGRVTYSYKSRYNLTANFRSDASSKFGPNNKRAYFPSLSASWNIANEEFLIDSDKVNNLKLRASIGSVGSTNVADFAYLQFFGTTASDIYNGGSGVVPDDNFPNRDIGWETTKEINLGLDFAFFNSRLKGSVDAYTRKTSDALASTPIALELGPSTYFSNFIDVSNKGIEVSLGGDIVRNEDFTWNTTVNWAFNRNKLDKLNGANIDEFLLDYFVEGEPVGTIKGYEVEKIIQSQEEIDALNAASPSGLYDQFGTGIGDYKYKDINGDGEITIDDRTIIGDIEPDYFGGISNRFTYRAFTLSALFQFSVGAETIWNPIAQSTFNLLGDNKYSAYALDTWTPDNRDARYARAVYFDPAASGRISDRYLFSTSYLRLKSLQLTYQVDNRLIENLGLSSASLSLTGSNLATWTDWPGLDPETLSERGTISDQVSSEDPYPLSKSFSLGIQVQF